MNPALAGHGRVEKLFKALRGVSPEKRRIRKTADLLRFTACLDAGENHRLMIPKECLPAWVWRSP